MPLQRWDVDGLAKTGSGAREARFGAFVDAAELFDASAFNTSRCTTLNPSTTLDISLTLHLPHYNNLISVHIGHAGTLAYSCLRGPLTHTRKTVLACP